MTAVWKIERSTQMRYPRTGIKTTKHSRFLQVVKPPVSALKPVRLSEPSAGTCMDGRVFTPGLFADFYFASPQMTLTKRPDTEAAISAVPAPVPSVAASVNTPSAPTKFRTTLTGVIA